MLRCGRSILKSARQFLSNRPLLNQPVDYIIEYNYFNIIDLSTVDSPNTLGESPTVTAVLVTAGAGDLATLEQTNAPILSLETEIPCNSWSIGLKSYVYHVNTKL